MLDAAGRLFGMQRFHEVRMEDIAAEAEVGKGTLYRYFADKEELYLALLERSSRQLMDRLQATVVRTDSPRGQLAAIVAELLAFFDSRPHLFNLIQRAEVLRESNRAFPWQKARDDLFRLVLALLKEGTAEGEFNIPEPEMSMFLLLGGLRSVIRFGKKPRPADLAEQIVESFLHGADLGARDPKAGPTSCSAVTASTSFTRS